MMQHYRQTDNSAEKRCESPLETIKERLEALKDKAQRKSTKELIDTIISIKKIGVDCSECEDIKIKKLFYNAKSSEVGERGRYIILDYHDRDRRTIIGEAKVVDITKQSLKKNGEKKGRELFEEYYLLEYVSNSDMYNIVEALKRHSDIIETSFVHTSFQRLQIE